MTSNTKDRIVELAVKLDKFLIKHSGRDVPAEEYKLQISSEDLSIIAELDAILTELHQIIVEQNL